MKKIYFLFLSLFMVFQLGAQSNKKLVLDANAEPRILGGFSAIEVSGAFNVYLSQGNEDGVAVSSSNPDMLKRISTEVSNGVLKIGFEGKGLSWKGWQDHELKAYVSLKTITSIKASGACNVKVVDDLQAQSLKIEMSGASDFRGKIIVQNLQLDASGASNLQLSGTAQEVKLGTSGASNIKAYGLTATNLRIHSSGASNIQVTVEKSLDVNSSGASDIYYKGSPSQITTKASGASTVKKSASDK